KPISTKHEEILIPNAFSPNSDGLNDVFNINGPHISNVRLEIYNRWRELLFISNDGINNGWDGTFMGESCQENIYVYVVKYNNKEGYDRLAKGTIHLMR